MAALSCLLSTLLRLNDLGVDMEGVKYSYAERKGLEYSYAERKGLDSEAIELRKMIRDNGDLIASLIEIVKRMEVQNEDILGIKLTEK